MNIAVIIIIIDKAPVALREVARHLPSSEEAIF